MLFNFLDLLSMLSILTLFMSISIASPWDLILLILLSFTMYPIDLLILAINVLVSLALTLPLEI